MFKREKMPVNYVAEKITNRKVPTEVVQLRKNTYNDQLQQSIFLCHKRNMSQLWQVNMIWQGQG